MPREEYQGGGENAGRGPKGSSVFLSASAEEKKATNWAREAPMIALFRTGRARVRYTRARERIRKERERGRHGRCRGLAAPLFLSHSLSRSDGARPPVQWGWGTDENGNVSQETAMGCMPAPSRDALVDFGPRHPSLPPHKCSWPKGLVLLRSRPPPKGVHALGGLDIERGPTYRVPKCGTTIR